MPLLAYGGTFRARTERREELVSALLQTANMMQSIPDCVQYIIGQSSDDPDEIRVLAIWTSKEAHDQAENHPAVRKFIGEALPMLDGKPSAERWIVRGGKGIGQ